jgi:intracellular sulfur oxidation DsrE/DsrF family protein
MRFASTKDWIMSFIRNLAAGAVLGLATTGAALAEDGDALVTVVTSGNAQTQLMAMVLTTQAVAQGASARVLLCGEGGALGLADAPEAATAPQPPRGASPQGMLAGLIERGVTVEVCAIFLPGMGADASVLMPGVGVAQPPAMAGAMLDDDVQVWSF